MGPWVLVGYIRGIRVPQERAESYLVRVRSGTRAVSFAYAEALNPKPKLSSQILCP